MCPTSDGGWRDVLAYDRPQTRTGAPPAVDSITDVIGRTPMVRLHCFDREISCRLFAKLESANPGGSVKDRTALALVIYGERTGLLRPGGTIVEPTSGNTGLALAIVAARRGYRCQFTVPDKVSEEKIALLRIYGATVTICPTAVPPEHPDSYYSVANRLTAELAGAYQPNQYANLANREVHYETTGPEIWEQTCGQISHLVSGAGTGGTISGTGRYIKECNPDIQVVCADPVGSVYSSPTFQAYLVEGVGEDFIPANYDKSVIDRVEAVTDVDAFSMCWRLVREEGILLGSSGGLALAAALRVSRNLPPKCLTVVIVPDSGRSYVSKVYSDRWLISHGLPRHNLFHECDRESEEHKRA